MSKQVKTLNLMKLRRDMQLIMEEIDRTGGVLPDYYSPVMWQRLQDTTDKVANAIQAVRMKLANPATTAEDIADKLGIGKMQVAGYIAWNTMLAPNWVAPRQVIHSTTCPTCGAMPGTKCHYNSAPAHKIHRERREAFKASHKRVTCDSCDRGLEWVPLDSPETTSTCHRCERELESGLSA